MDWVCIASRLFKTIMNGEMIGKRLRGIKSMIDCVKKLKIELTQFWKIETYDSKIEKLGFGS